MTAISNYPFTGPIIRGDPLCIPITISDLDEETGIKTPIDVSGFMWRAHVRRSYDSQLITEFAIEVVVPEGGTVPNQVLLSLDTFQTTILKTGYVFDLEQIIDNATPQTYLTWWLVEKITVHKDVSHA